MKKPTVYLDTSVISAYWYEGTDVLALARRVKTHEWWDVERGFFALRGSVVVETELRDGRFPRQADCQAMARRLSYLPITSGTRDLFDALIAEKVVPENKPRDAFHMALAAVHEVDYLLSWNYAHMVNVIAQRKYEQVGRIRKLRAPLLVSPESIPWVNLGQTIRRLDE
jgi:hypothetical protein